MNEEEDEIRIDIKAIGGSIGRRAIPNKPNVGKNPKDGDGDGFVVDLTTGLDNVPFKPVRQYDGSGSERNPMVAGVPVRRANPAMMAGIERMLEDATKPKRRESDRRTSDSARLVERIAEEEKRKQRLREGFLNGDLTPQEEADQLEDMLKQPQKIDGDIHGQRRLFNDAAKRYIRYARNGGTQSFAEWSKRNFKIRDDRQGNVMLTIPRNLRVEKSLPEPMSSSSGMYEQQDEDAELEPRQRIMYEFFELIAKKMGKWEQDAGPNGAHYMEEQPFGDKGMKCINCSFFQGGNRCEIVVGEIKPEAICKLWVIRKDLVKE